MISQSNVCGLLKRGIITYSLDFLVLYCKIKRDSYMIIAFYFCKYLLSNLSFNYLFVYQVSCLGFLLQKLKSCDSSTSGFSDFA